MPDKLNVLLPIRQAQQPLQLQTHAQALESNSSQCVFGGETLHGFVCVSQSSEEALRFNSDNRAIEVTFEGEQN